MEIVVDTYGPEEQAMGWYSYLEDILTFPFLTRCRMRRTISPLQVGDEVGGINYGIPDPNWDLDITSEQRIRVGDIVSAVKNQFVYEYDFGDGWLHGIVVGKVLPPQADVRYPVCLTGKRACPPEDVGGIWGYAEFVEAIRDPKHPEHADILAWVGGSFDPLEFDVEAVNQELKRL
jgi:hypothetical protein